jgi:hypothetical protein
MLDNDPAPNPAPNLNGLANENEIVLRISLSTGSFASTLQELERRMSGSGARPDCMVNEPYPPSYYCAANAATS